MTFVYNHLTMLQLRKQTCQNATCNKICIKHYMSLKQRLVFVAAYCSQLVEFAIAISRPIMNYPALNTLWCIFRPSCTQVSIESTVQSRVSELQNIHTDGLFIFAGDFNHANLKSVPPKFYLHLNSIKYYAFARSLN